MSNAATTDKKDLEALFEKAKGSLAQVLPKHLPVERVIRVALAARSRNPRLMKSTADSILQAVMISSQIGLEAGGPLGHAYLVPYKNGRLSTPNNEVYECQFQVGYKGLIELARRSGTVNNIEARAVRAKDKFSFCYGTAPVLIHEPSIESDPGPMTHVYAVVYPKDGSPTFEVMSKADVDRIRKRSKSADDGPWLTDYEEMAKKTVIKKVLKYQRLSSELADAIDYDSAATGYEDAFDVEAEEEIEEPKRLSEKKEPAKKEPTNQELDLQLEAEEKKKG